MEQLEGVDDINDVELNPVSLSMPVMKELGENG